VPDAETLAVTFPVETTVRRLPERAVVEDDGETALV
jgi:hypothetical protein